MQMSIAFLFPGKKWQQPPEDIKTMPEAFERRNVWLILAWDGSLDQRNLKESLHKNENHEAHIEVLALHIIVSLSCLISWEMPRRKR